MTHALNLCPTVEAFPVYMLLPCVPRPKPQAFFPANRDEESTRRHEWPNGKTARCAHCARLLREVRVRLNPKTNEPVRSSLARAIAFNQSDVPPLKESQ